MTLCNSIVCLYFCIVNFCHLIFPIRCDHYERQLYEDLLANYNPFARPVQNDNESIFVFIGLSLQQLLDVVRRRNKNWNWTKGCNDSEQKAMNDEKNEQIHTSIILNVTWVDYFLKWSPDDNDGIRDLRFDHDEIWKPDILLYNSVAEEFDRTFLKARLIVKNTGHVEWRTPAIVVSSCSLDILWFPFDTQNCFLKYGSWTFTDAKLDLRVNEIGLDTSDCWANGEWEIFNDTKPVREIKVYPCCPEVYPSINFYIRIRRKTLFYGFTLIIPSLLITLMTVLGFMLPTDSGEKLTLETTVLMTVCFMLSLVANQTPATSQAIPVISTFYFIVNCVVSASVLFTVFVLNLHHRTCHTNEMSPMMRSIFLNWLPWMLMMKRPGHRYTYRNAKEAARHMSRDDTRSTEIFTINSSDSATFSTSSSFQSFKEEYRKRTSDLDSQLIDFMQPLVQTPTTSEPKIQALLLLMQRFQAEMKFVLGRMEDEDDEAAVECDWKFAAMVLDRFCLYIFTMFIFTSTIGIFFSAPHIL